MLAADRARVEHDVAFWDAGPEQPTPGRANTSPVCGPSIMRNSGMADVPRHICGVGGSIRGCP